MDKLLPAAAYFQGHFPGRPILPGVTQLALAARALAQRTGGGLLSAIHHVRLRQLILPGEELALEAQGETNGRVRFQLRRDTTVVTNGELTLSDSLANWSSADPSTTLRDALQHPSIEMLLPHRSPMRFVERVLDCTDERVVCEASIPSACPLVSDDCAPAVAMIEAAAQGAAVGEALRRIAMSERKVTPSGYLVSLRDVEFACATVPADEAFVVVVRLESRALPLSTYLVEAFHANRPVLRGTIGTFLADR